MRIFYFWLALFIVGSGIARADEAPARPDLPELASALQNRWRSHLPKLWGEHLPGVVSSLPARPPATGVPANSGLVVALTLDACGGHYDAELIAFLRRERIPATIFVTDLWIRANPGQLQKLACDPLFEIGAHGSRHKPCSVNGKEAYGIKGTASIHELVEEVEKNARNIESQTGRRPAWFRSGTAFYDDTAVSVIRELGFQIAGYSLNGDQGATLPAAKVAKTVAAAKGGDIIVCHMNRPQSGTRQGLMEALPRLKAKGAHFLTLSKALGGVSESSAEPVSPAN